MNPVRAKKQFGQHFLNDRGIAKAIADALTHHGGYRSVVEIGPGTGALTVHLIDRTDIDLWCVEVDREAAAHVSGAIPRAA
jgi:16S rRNA (adenine1518-N6/adenine1519-N6)-dimethyltransferase